MKLFATATVYIFLVIVYTYPVVSNINSMIVGSDDAYLHLWGVLWFKDALYSGLSIWNCSDIFYPYGVNMIQHDTTLVPSVMNYVMSELGLTPFASYNITCLIAMFLNAMTMFLLAKAVTGNWAPAFMAGILFSFSTYFWSRMEGFFPYLHAYPIVLTALSVNNLFQYRSIKWSIATGFSLALAVYCHFYYAVYSIIYVLLYFTYKSLSFSFDAVRRINYQKTIFNLSLILGSCFFILSVLVAYTGGGEFELFGTRVSVRKNNILMILWWLSWLVAFFTRFSVKIMIKKKYGVNDVLNILKISFYMIIPLVLIAPVLVEILRLVIAGDYAVQSTSWKGGIGGAYFLSAFIPNKYNYFFGDIVQQLFSFGELLDSDAGSISLGITAIVIILRSGLLQKSSWWRFSFVCFLLMSLGPFLRILPGLDHGPVLPFWFARYVPVINGARVPLRWFVIALVVWSILFAIAFKSLKCSKWKIAVAFFIFVEAFSAPLKMSSVVVPDIYHKIAMDKRSISVLELPFGAMDGRHGSGHKFQAVKQYYQRVHGKYLLGGYIGRVPDRIFDEYESNVFLSKLMSLQDSMDVSLSREEVESGLKEFNVGWVVLDKKETSSMLKEKIFTILGPQTHGNNDLVAWDCGEVFNIK